MNALSKANLVELLVNDVKLLKDDAKNFVEVFFEDIRKTLESGQHVKLSGFGNFILRDKVARPGRNPKTKEEIAVEARRVVTFRPGLKLKAQVKNSEVGN